MNIWLISKYGSPKTRQFNLAKEWVKMGHDVTIITSNTNRKHGNFKEFKGQYFVEESEWGGTVVWLKSYFSKHDKGFERIKSWLHFEWLLRRFNKAKLSRPNVVIISSLSLLSVINAYYYAKKYSAKLIFEVRDIWPLTAIVLGGYKRTHPFIFLLSKIEKFGYKKANAIVGTMPNLAEHINEIIGKQEKTYCIPQGISLDFYSKSESLTPEYIEEHIPQNKFIIAYTGRLNANNPLDTLLSAAYNLSNYSDLHFLIVGEGYEKNNLMRKAMSMKNVSFPPTVKREQVNHLLSFVEVCYDSFESTLAKYGLSRNKWIDYMYASKPIICSYSGYKSMINEAESGSFVPFGDVEELTNTILKYYKMDAKEIQEEGLRGKNFLLKNRKFDILAARYIEIINNH